MWNQPDWREGVSLGSHGEEIFFLLMCLGFHLTLGIPSFNHTWKSGLNTQVDASQKNIFLASLTLSLILRVRGKKISLYSYTKRRSFMSQMIYGEAEDEGAFNSDPHYLKVDTFHIHHLHDSKESWLFTF